MERAKREWLSDWMDRIVEHTFRWLRLLHSYLSVRDGTVGQLRTLLFKNWSITVAEARALRQLFTRKHLESESSLESEHKRLRWWVGSNEEIWLKSSYTLCIQFPLRIFHFCFEFFEYTKEGLKKRAWKFVTIFLYVVNYAFYPRTFTFSLSDSPAAYQSWQKNLHKRLPLFGDSSCRLCEFTSEAISWLEKLDPRKLNLYWYKYDIVTRWKGIFNLKIFKMLEEPRFLLFLFFLNFFGSRSRTARFNPEERVFEVSGGSKGGKEQGSAGEPSQGWAEVRVRFKRWKRRRDLVKGVSTDADINWACHQGKRRDLPKTLRYIEVAFSTPLKNSWTRFAEKCLESPRGEITFLFSRLIETIRPRINRFHGWKLNLSLVARFAMDLF